LTGKINFQQVLGEHGQAIDAVAAAAEQIQSIANMLDQVFAAGGRVFACGNGGSAADAQHFSAELTGRYQNDRRGYPAIALTTDTSALTSIGNDYGFQQVFARQLQALAVPGDVLIAISTSGNSANIIHAVEYAHANGIHTIGLLGKDGGQLKDQVHDAITIGVQHTGRIQEAHILVLHLLCEAFE
jgi:D-sedoheptulose 7-phosphate isomerase